MTNELKLICLVAGESASNAFSVKASSSLIVDELKKLIKAEKAIDFHDIDADKLTLWRVSIPDDDNDDDDFPMLLDTVHEKKKLKATNKLSKLFDAELPEDTIHILVQRPQPVHAPLPARVSTPLSGYLSDQSRPGTPLSGDLRVDIKKITDKFFAPGTPIANFLNAFVRGQGTPDHHWSYPRNLASTSILDMVKENNRPLIPVFGVSGCGKTRAVIELLSQHWGFYFNASSDDWGSSDMMTLHSTVEDYLSDTRGSSAVDRQANNAFARKTTLLLFLSRILIFRHCLNVRGSSDTFTSARWTLLQVCPHVLFKDDVFDILFRQVLKLRHYPISDLLDLVRDVYEDTKGCIIRHGCLPNIKDDTRLLVILDEAQFLGDEFNGYFQSMSSSDETPRPLLSPILHAFRDIGGHQLTLVTCGTGLSINTLFWVQSSGSGLKDSSTNFEYIEFPGWTDQESIKAYISRVRKCLLDDDSRQALDERLPQEAIDMLFED
ncbi:hypothetical protein BG011_000187 [Mortierella polycephala]|uniref:Crinkler effector protein N-terminal domain-containing protein n=1 Tax=Mortierella polycephala TaxID=41804 RepID=A0A9P6PMA3_9FUNG|nr:hypothetical protein BG011_000187 [Mortierella polycephala]